MGLRVGPLNPSSQDVARGNIWTERASFNPVIGKTATEGRRSFHSL